MDTVIREYEVDSKAAGCALVNALQVRGYNVKAMLVARKRGATLPANSFYQVWSDGTVTWDDTPMDMPEVKADCYSLVLWDKSVLIEHLKELTV